MEYFWLFSTFWWLKKKYKNICGFSRTFTLGFFLPHFCISDFHLFQRKSKFGPFSIRARVWDKITNQIETEAAVAGSAENLESWSESS